MRSVDAVLHRRPDILQHLCEDAHVEARRAPCADHLRLWVDVYDAALGLAPNRHDDGVLVVVADRKRFRHLDVRADVAEVHHVGENGDEVHLLGRQHRRALVRCTLHASAVKEGWREGGREGGREGEMGLGTFFFIGGHGSEFAVQQLIGVDLALAQGSAALRVPAGVGKRGGVAVGAGLQQGSTPGRM